MPCNQFTGLVSAFDFVKNAVQTRSLRLPQQKRKPIPVFKELKAKQSS